MMKTVLYTEKGKASYNPEAQKEIIIFNEHLIDWNEPIYIVEGAFDSIFIPNSIPMLGKFRVHADSKIKSLMQLFEAEVPNVVVSSRGSKVLSSMSRAIPGVYIYLEE